MDGIALTSSYTWTEAMALGVTRGQIRADGIPISRGLYVSRSADLDLHTLCRAWARVLPPDAAFGFRTAVALHGAGAGGRSPIHVVLRPRSVLPQRVGLRV